MKATTQLILPAIIAALFLGSCTIARRDTTQSLNTRTRNKTVMKATKAPVTVDGLYDTAQKAYADSNYPKTLDALVQYYDLSFRQMSTSGHAGVRASFALALWTELGEKYPMAINKLLEIRDFKASQLRSGKVNAIPLEPEMLKNIDADYRDTFTAQMILNDIVNISRRLRDLNYALSLFVELEETKPTLASEIWPEIRETAMQERRFDIAARHIKDVRSEFTRLKKTMDSRLKDQEQMLVTGTFPPQMHDSIVAVIHNQFIQDVNCLLAFSCVNNLIEDARWIAAEANAVFPDGDFAETLDTLTAATRSSAQK